MKEADRTLEMLVCREILVVSIRGAIIREAQSLPFLEVGVQQALVASIKADTALC